MANYLIEFRFQSAKIKRYLQGMIYDVNRKFHVGKRRHIPHITLVGPLTTNNERKLIYDFAKVCSETNLMKFKGNGFGTFDSNRVVYVNIAASDRLNEFRVKLVDTLKQYCSLQSHDKKRDDDKFGYHSTLAMKLSDNEFNRIKNYIQTQPKPNFSQVVMRVTLLRDGKILREYDFLQKRLLNRGQALNRHISRRSKELIRRFFEGSYNPDEVVPQFEESKPQSLWNKFKSFFGV